MCCMYLSWHYRCFLLPSVMNFYLPGIIEMTKEYMASLINIKDYGNNI
jgi:hypothetical protein